MPSAVLQDNQFDILNTWAALSKEIKSTDGNNESASINNEKLQLLIPDSFMSWLAPGREHRDDSKDSVARLQSKYERMWNKETVNKKIFLFWTESKKQRLVIG